MKAKQYKILKFGKRIPSHYRKMISDLENSQHFIRIYKNQKPYKAIYCNKKIVACIWLETDKDEKEFSVITHEQYQRRGYATLLIKELVCDVFSGVIKDEITCVPVNKYIKNVIINLGFIEFPPNSGMWCFEL